MREGIGDYSNEDLERDVKDGKLTVEEAKNIRELWENIERLEDANKVPRSLLDFEVTI